MAEEKRPLVLQVKPQDNVAIAVRDLPAGTKVAEGICALQDIPQA